MNNGAVNREYIYPLEITASFLLYIYPEVRLPDNMVVLFLIFWGTSILFSMMTESIYYPTYSAQEFHFIHILANNCCLLSLTGVKWYLVVLIFISLMITNVEHFFMFLLAMCTSMPYAHCYVFFKKILAILTANIFFKFLFKF